MNDNGSGFVWMDVEAVDRFGYTLTKLGMNPTQMQLKMEYPGTIDCSVLWYCFRELPKPGNTITILTPDNRCVEHKVHSNL